MNMIELTRHVLATRKPDVLASNALYRSYVSGHQIARVGMDSSLGIAHRLGCGLGIEEAASREYLYRWNLALKSPVFGVPHTLGM